MNCRFCGAETAEGIPFDQWVKPTFTDWDKLLPGDCICADCQFWFDESSAALAERVGKDKPQRMRNYSHFVLNGAWIPLTKGDKAQMVGLLLGESFPELAAIAVSGQKHIVFRAVRNPPGGSAGWAQFEEQRMWVDSAALRSLLDTAQALYAGFSKSEIESGQYQPHRILQFGIERWQLLEARVKSQRGSLLFQLALFLAQRSDDDSGIEAAGDGTPAGNLARDTGGLQEPLPDEHLGAVRKPNPQRGLHQQPGEIRQLALFPNERDGGDASE
jgi:hypothetical protein